MFRAISGPNLSSDYIVSTFAAPPQVSAAFFMRKAKLFPQNPGACNFACTKEKRPLESGL